MATACFPEPESAEQGLRLSVLVVDDHQPNRRIMAVLLESLGCAVSCAASGEEAVELARHAIFDLVVMDLHMTGIGGDEATRRLRAHGRSRSAFVVQWSSDPMGRLNHGLYDARLAKPAALDELQALVAEVRRRLQGRVNEEIPVQVRFRPTT
ncbi:MAG TPA: response regulator [Caulobacteraceae bacterium]|nr:response regulator [Caulobacteraceae bacterium]